MFSFFIVPIIMTDNMIDFNFFNRKGIGDMSLKMK